MAEIARKRLQSPALSRRWFLGAAGGLAAALMTESAAGAPPESEADGDGAGEGGSREGRLGPVRVHPENGRCFADPAGRAVLLAGSHLGWELQDDAWDRELTFDFERYLDLLARHRQNAIRLWCVEHTRSSDPRVGVAARPMPFARSGSQKALDGRPQFDLGRFDDEYFGRLGARVELARRRGIYVIVMLFQGWSARPSKRHQPWHGHYLNPRNNTAGLDGDRDGDGSGRLVHTLRQAAVTAVQEAYVRKVVETVGDAENVLYEIANESLGSEAWHRHIVSVIRGHRQHRASRQPILLSGCRRGLTNAVLRGNDAEAIGVSRTEEEDYLADPPPSDGTHVVVADSDHIAPKTKDPAFVWKNFLRGNHPLVLDWGLAESDDASWEPIRHALGTVRTLAEQMAPAALVPRSDLASTGYCLASPGKEYLVYLPEGGAATVKLEGDGVNYRLDWRRADGTSAAGGKETAREAVSSRDARVAGGAVRRIESPWRGAATAHLLRI